MISKRRVLSVFLILSLLLTTVGVLGDFDSYAASKKKKKAPKNITVTVIAVNPNAVTLRWNKIKKPYKGYAVFRDGVAIAHFGKNTTMYCDAVAAGSTHSYQIKSYKVKKVKKKKKYQYKKKSNVVSASTPAPTVEPTGISVASNNIELHVGESFRIEPVVSPNNATNKTVNWYYNSDPDVASIDNNGVVTAKKEGTTFVSAATYNYAYSTGVIAIEVLGNSEPEPTPTPSFSMKLPNTPKTINCYWSNSSTNWARCRIDSLVLETKEIGSAVYGKVYVSGIKVGDGDYIYGKTRCAIKYKVLGESGIEYDSGILFFDAVSTNESISGTINFSCPKLDVSLELSDVFPSDLDS